MLLKIFVDDSFPIAVKTATYVWVVQDALPLAHPQNIAGLLQALKKPANTPLSFDGLYFSHSGALVDPRKTPTELSLSAHALINVNRQAPASPRRVRSQTMATTPRDGGETPRDGGDDDDEVNNDARVEQDGDDGDDKDREAYAAQEHGWLPFGIASDGYGNSIVQVIDPQREPNIDDRAPNVVNLCASCSHTVSNAHSMPADVDRHYKPMLLETNVASGWVEKLGGTRIQRWQRRWLEVSEKSVDWFEQKPVPGEKPKIRGSRPVTLDNDFNITDIVVTVDPAKFPKATDPKFFYFAVSFKEPAQTTLYRVPSSQEKNMFVKFLQRLARRWQQKGATRDPVFWKQWVDHVLVTSSDVGETCAAASRNATEYNEEADRLEHAIEQTIAARPALQEKVQARLDVVNALKEQLRALDDRVVAHRKKAETAEAKVAVELEKLHELKQECNEEVRHHKFLEQRAVQQREEARTAVEHLDTEIEAAAEAKRSAFAKWRQFEEHHTDRAEGDRHMKRYSFSIARQVPQ